MRMVCRRVLTSCRTLTDRRRSRAAPETGPSHLSHLRNRRRRRDTGGESPMSATSEPAEQAEDWGDLWGPPSAPRAIPAERIPQPLWYFPPRDEGPPRLWQAARRVA